MKQFKNVLENKPSWVKGAITGVEAHFIFKEISTNPKITTAVEIGVASGFSTAVITASLLANSQYNSIDISNYKIHGIDINPRCYFDESKKTGEAAFQLLPSEYHKMITFEFDHFGSILPHLKNNIDFLFIDANHKHPWPIIDLLNGLNKMSNNALIILHDINLSNNNPGYGETGPNKLFYGLSHYSCIRTTSLPNHGKLYPNIGSICIRNKTLLINELREILFRNENSWEDKSLTKNQILKELLTAMPLS